MDLKSQYHEGELFGKKVVLLPVKDLHVTVVQCNEHFNKPFFKNLTEDIQRDGLQFPLMVVETTKDQLRAQKQIYKDRMLPIDDIMSNYLDEEKFYVCWGGSQRQRVAQNLGYENVDCIIFENGDYRGAMARQQDMRKPYIQRYYTN